MKVNPLPPQAYTKETLQKAYTWLLNQSASVKDMATTQDMLISLYLKAQRSGDASLETPSIQNFKQELKSLATMIGDLQTPSPPPVHNSAPVAHPPPASPSVPVNTSIPTNPPLHSPHSPAPAPTISNSPPPTTAPNLASTSKVATQNNSLLNSGSGASSGSGSSSSLGQLDLQSLQILSDVRHNLNLSSDIEALRMLITLGYRQIKKMT